MTAAQTIANLFSNDGKSFQAADGRELTDICDRQSTSVSRDDDKTRYDFADDSAIVVMPGAWDLLAPGCNEYCWEDAGCRCSEDNEAAL